MVSQLSPRHFPADVRPPDWPTYPSDPLSAEILTGTISAMSEIMPSLAVLKGARLPDALVKGGVIVAWGETDIYDSIKRVAQAL